MLFKMLVIQQLLKSVTLRKDECFAAGYSPPIRPAHELGPSLTVVPGANTFISSSPAAGWSIAQNPESDQPERLGTL